MTAFVIDSLTTAAIPYTLSMLRATPGHRIVDTDFDNIAETERDSKVMRN